MAHHHSTGQANKKNLTLAMILIGSWMFIQFAGGLWTGSLALLADAVHMLNDFGNLFISLLAIILAAKAATATRTFGNHRFEVLSSLLNGVMLLVIAFFIIREAIERFIEPQEVMGGWMLVLALIGLLVNIGAMFVLSRGDVKNNLNMRGAYLHVLGDTLGSVAAVMAGLIIILTGWYTADPLLSIIISILISISAIRLLKEVLHVLMEGAPAHIETEKVRDKLASIPGVKQVDDLRIWTITSGKDSVTTHLRIANTDSESYQTILQKAYTYLHNELNIEYVTVQLDVQVSNKPVGH